MKMTMSGRGPVLGMSAVVSMSLLVALTGCGTTITSSPSQPGTTQAQSQPPSGPILGFVWDATSQSLRPVQGIPGASIVGSAIISAPSQGPSFIAAASSGVSGMAVFLDANGGVYQSLLTGGPLSKIASLPGATSLVLSNSGGYALVTGQSNAGISNALIISGLPQTPAAHSLNVSALGSILGVAASDTGTVAMATGSGQSGISIVAFVGQAAGAQVATAEAFGGLQFVPNSDELVIADDVSGAVTAISHVNTTPSSAVLSGPGGITSPVALDITVNGRWVVAANHTGDVLRIDLTNVAASTKMHCSCAPTKVLALNGSSNGTAVRLVTAAGGPLWVVDAGNPAPRVLFIPAITTGTVPTITKSAM
jgi:hypothetical protein